MLKDLSRALEDDEMDDFSNVVDASDTARVRTVNTLNDLFLRMQERVSNGREVQQAQVYRSGYREAGANDRISEPQIGPSQASPPNLPVRNPPNDDIETPPQPMGQVTSFSPKQPQEKKGFSYFQGLLPSRRRKRGDTSPAADNDDGGQEHASPELHGLDRRHTELGRSSTLESLSTSYGSAVGSTPNTTWRDSTETGNYGKRRVSTQERPGQPLHPSTTFPTQPPTPGDYQGFCKGAYYLQVNLKKDGIKLRNQSGSFQGENFYYACSSSKCCFEFPARKFGKEWGFDDKVYGPRHGVQFRWSFLAKSHVEQAKARNQKYQYRCIFCALHNVDNPVLQGINSLIEHVSLHQDEQVLTQGRVTVDGDDFDVQLRADGQHADTESLGSQISSSPIQEVPSWSASDKNPWTDDD